MTHAFAISSCLVIFCNNFMSTVEPMATMKEVISFLLAWKRFLRALGQKIYIQRKMLCFENSNREDNIRSSEVVEASKKCVRNHPQLEWQIVWFCLKKDMLYIIFTGFSYWFQQCNSWNDPMADFRGQPLLGHLGPSPTACFGSNDRGFEPLVTAETGGKARPTVP